MADPEGYIVWYNRRWLDYTGKTLEQMWGRRWVPVLEADVQPKVLERWEATVAAAEPFEMVIQLKGKDDVYRPFLTRVQTVKDDLGRVVRWFGTNTDITELKRAEEALKQADRRKNEFLALITRVPLTGSMKPVRLRREPRLRPW